MRGQKKTLIVGALLATLAGACGEDFTIADEPLSGTVGGERWTYVTAETSFFLSEGQDDYFASFYPAEFEPCGFGAPTEGSYLIISVPKSTGEYEFSTSLNMTFVIDDGTEIDNLVSFDGIVRVDEVSETLVRGGVAASYDGDNEISGTFELTVCPDDGF